MVRYGHDHMHLVVSRANGVGEGAWPERPEGRAERLHEARVRAREFTLMGPILEWPRLHLDLHEPVP